MRRMKLKQEGGEGGKTYSGVDPVIVDNDTNQISINNGSLANKLEIVHPYEVQWINPDKTATFTGILKALDCDLSKYDKIIIRYVKTSNTQYKHITLDNNYEHSETIYLKPGQLKYSVRLCFVDYYKTTGVQVHYSYYRNISFLFSNQGTVNPQVSISMEDAVVIDKDLNSSGGGTIQVGGTANNVLIPVQIDFEHDKIQVNP